MDYAEPEPTIPNISNDEIIEISDMFGEQREISNRDIYHHIAIILNREVIENIDIGEDGELYDNAYNDNEENEENGNRYPLELYRDMIDIDLIRPTPNFITNIINHLGISVPPDADLPNPDDPFWEPVANRLDDRGFDSCVETVRMSKAIREKYCLDPVCVICQEDINSRQKCSILKCNHLYHTKCIKEWLTKTCETPSCPTCRKDVRESGISIKGVSK